MRQAIPLSYFLSKATKKPETDILWRKTNNAKTDES